MENTGKLMYAASESASDLLYVTGFSAPDPFLWLSFNGQDYMIVSTMELERARKQARSNQEIMTIEQAALRWNLGDAKRSTENLIAAIARAENIWDWDIDSSFPYGLADKLWNTELEVEGTDSKSGMLLSFKVVEPFCPSRDIKTRDEVEKIRHAQHLAEAGLAKGLKALREATVDANGILHWNGEILTAEILQGEVNAEISHLNGIAAGTIAAPGCQSADPHQRGFGPCKAGEPIIFDIFPKDTMTGYCGDLSRTVVKGHAPEIVKQVFDAVLEAHDTAISMIKPGLTGKEVHEKADEVMKARGFMTDFKAAKPYGFFHSLGHGVGLDVHEKPGLGPRSEGKLQAGHIVTVEPGLYYPEWGGVRIEDLIHVTETGAENLSTAEIFLEIE